MEKEVEKSHRTKGIKHDEGKTDEIRVKMCSLNNVSSALCFALLIYGAF